MQHTKAYGTPNLNFRLIQNQKVQLPLLEVHLKLHEIFSKEFFCENWIYVKSSIGNTIFSNFVVDMANIT